MSASTPDEPTNVTDPAETVAPDQAGQSGESVDLLTVFETLESAFWWVAVGPLPLTIHPRGFADLPERALSLHQLRVRLASPTVSQQSRAAIWSYLVRHARTRGPQQPDWTIAAAGIALPELMRIVASLANSHHGQSCDLADLEAAALGAFYHELRRVDLDNTRDYRIRSRLLMAAYRGARTLRDTTHHATTSSNDGPDTSDGDGEGGDGTGGDQPGRPTGPPRGARGRYPRSSTRKLHRARRQARQARLARQRAGRTRGGQVRP